MTNLEESAAKYLDKRFNNFEDGDLGDQGIYAKHLPEIMASWLRSMVEEGAQDQKDVKL